MSEWIECSNRLPTKDECDKNHGWFLVARSSSGRADLSRYDGHEEDYSYEHGWKYVYDNDITHWMSLPKLPKDL